MTHRTSLVAGYDVGAGAAIRAAQVLIRTKLQDPAVQKELTYDEVAKALMRELDRLATKLRAENPFAE